MINYNLYYGVREAVHRDPVQPNRICVETFWTFDSQQLLSAMNYLQLCGYKTIEFRMAQDTEKKTGDVLIEAWKQKGADHA